MWLLEIVRFLFGDYGLLFDGLGFLFGDRQEGWEKISSCGGIIRIFFIGKFWLEPELSKKVFIV